MKHAKKLASLLLALVMVFALTLPAFAVSGNGTDNNGKITINNTVKDATYKIYCIFDLESFDTATNTANGGAYSYKVNADWAGYFTEENAATNGRKYVDIDANGYVTMKADADVATFAKEALAYAEAAGVATAAEPQTVDADNTPVVFEALPLGYYLVDSSVGTLCALTTTNPEATVIEKNANPTLVKEVKEGETWGKLSDASINDTVEFRATITVHGIAKDYVMHDKMDDGLTFGSVTSVTLTQGEATTTATEGNDYTVVPNIEHLTPSDTTPTSILHTFDVVFTEAFCSKLNSGDVIVVSYTATLNDKACLEDGKDSEENVAHLEYKDNNGETHTTEPDTTKTYTWQADVFKYYMNGEAKTPLAGATFTLSRNPDGSNPIELTPKEIVTEDVPLEPLDSRIIGTTNTYRYRVATAEDTDKTTEITTTDVGKLTIDGLDAGTYYLTEVTPPSGYNRLAGPIKVEITKTAGTAELTSTVTYYNHTGDASAPYAAEATGTGEIQVENKSGTELPETGGIGTTIFYVVGSILLVGAVVLLITKKRMSTEK